MKIIKEGKTKEQLEKIPKYTKRFECKTCGCIFEADNDEYEVEDNRCRVLYFCKCPNCEHRAFEVRTRCFTI